MVRHVPPYNRPIHGYASGSSRYVARLLALALFASVLAIPAVPAGASNVGRATPAFNESDGCQDPAGFHGPRATRTGLLPHSEPLYGPLGDTFGRTISAVESQLVWWTIPMSDGKRVRVHRLALPAFQKVAGSLNQAARNGLWYQVKNLQTSAYVRRTIGGRESVSLHAFGIAIDINAATNPYRSDNRLVTDMPIWFVEAWRDAGFCWGGDWREVKDAMHFSWKGPQYTPGYPYDLTEQPPYSAPRDWSRSIPTPLPWANTHPAAYFLRDGNRDGAFDVYRLRPWGGGTLIELARSSRDFAICGAWREWSPATNPLGPMLMADYDGTSRLDLWQFDTSGSTVAAKVWLQREDFKDWVSLTTGIPVSEGMQFEAGDIDDDGAIDLVVGRAGESTRVEVWSGASGFDIVIGSASVDLPTTTSTLHISVTDIDNDDSPDLVVAATTGTGADIAITTAESNFTVVKKRVPVKTSSELLTVDFGDFDGDGRDDIITLDQNGETRAHLGGALPSSVDLRNWFRDPDWHCPDDSDVDLPGEIDQHISRIAGSDRYETAAAVSAKHFPGGSDTVVIASGLDFPDALSGAPLAAALAGPVLLTHPKVLPSVVAAEIRRLGASRVIIAGGTAAVSQSVATGLNALPSVEVVERAHGADRYATAAALASLMPDPSVVYIATGAKYPDALAAAPAAAHEGAPILLVSETGIPAATRTALEQIGPDKVVILGGTAVVDSAIESQLTKYGHVVRLAGATRYSTAAVIGSSLPNNEHVLLVTGSDFADALGAGAVAAASQTPLLLIEKNHIPIETARYLTSINASSIEIVGGPFVITELVRALLIEYVYPD